MKTKIVYRSISASLQGSLCFRILALTVVTLAALLTSTRALGQGAYYPVSPAGAPYGSTYTGITISTSVDLTYLQQMLQTLYGSTVTLEVPVPAGAVAPTAGQYDAAVTACVQAILGGTAPAGVTLTSFSNASVAWDVTDRATTAGAIAQGVIQVDYTTNNNPAQTVTDLNAVTNGLAVSQPTLIDSIIPGILAQAQGQALLAIGIPQIVATAISDIPTDLTRITSIVSSGLASISSANLTAGQRTNLLVEPNASGFIYQLMHSSSASNNPMVIQVISQDITNGGVLDLAGLQDILTSAVLSLPTKSNLTLAAITDGALISQGNGLPSQGSGAANIQSYIQAAAPGTYSAYIAAVVGGYSNGGSLSALQSYLSAPANHGYADAIASGAVIAGSLAPSVILQNALTLGITGTSGDPNPSNVVEEAMLANVSEATSTIAGAIDPSSHTPYGYTNYSVGETIQDAFGKITLGAVEGTPLQNMGNVVATIVFSSASSLAALSSTTVNSIVTNAIDGANAVNSPGAYADIVYKAESIARNTTGVSGQMVIAAINEINHDGGLPYIAAVAAAAGDTFGANRNDIQTNASAALSAISSTYATAGADGMNLVQTLQTNSTKTFTSMLSAFNSASGSGQDAVIADVYGAVMADPNEVDAALAGSIKQSAVSDATLTTAAENAIRGINGSLTQNLQVVDTVAEYLKTEALSGGINDVLGYVGEQIVLNPSLTNDIAIAATVVDPDQANFIGHSVAFNNPQGVAGTVGSIFTYAQITNPNPLAMPLVANPNGGLPTKSFYGGFGAVYDQPAAAAAITAGLVNGILEANLSQANTQTALSNTVAAAVAASISQNGTLLQGPTNPFNGTGSGTQFQQSNGTTWNGASPSTSARSVGAAGAITGFIAEVTEAGDTTIGFNPNTTVQNSRPANTTIVEAVLTASVGGGARPYALAIAQAAGQAFAWVAQYSATPFVNTTVGNPVYDIAEAMAPSVTGFATLTQLENAVAFGISQAENGVIGAGAVGLNAAGLYSGTLVIDASGNANADFYENRSAAGDPVTDIFNL